MLWVLLTRGFQRAADDLVADTRQVLHPTATHEHDRVLLQVVADAGDVRGDLDAGRQTDTGHLAQRRVRLLRRRREDARAHAAALRRTAQGRGLRLLGLALPTLADELGDRGHRGILELSVACWRVMVDGSCWRALWRTRARHVAPAWPAQSRPQRLHVDGPGRPAFSSLDAAGASLPGLVGSGVLLGGGLRGGGLHGRSRLDRTQDGRGLGRSLRFARHTERRRKLRRREVRRRDLDQRDRGRSRRGLERGHRGQEAPVVAAVLGQQRGPEPLGEIEVVLVVAGVEGQRLVVGRLGGHVAVLRHAGPRGDQLADDDVLLEALEAVVLALDRGFREDSRRLLEGGGGEPRLGRERGLGDAHELGPALGGTLLLGHQPLVHVRELAAVGLLAGQEVRVTGLRDRDPAEHLADDHLDVLVVDRHALLPVHLLHLVDEVLLGGPDAVDVENLLRVPGRLDVAGELGARHDLGTVHDAGGKVRAHRDRVDLLLTVVGDHRDGALALLALAEADDTGVLGERRRALRGAGLEQLDDTRQAV